MVMVIAAALTQGCEAIDHAVEIPSYISIDSVDLQVDYPTQGTDAHKITDVWVHVGAENMGAYELPATIPVLQEGMQEVKIFAGIKVNGSSIVRDPYPFFKAVEQSVKLVPGATTSITPQVTYYSNLTFAWLEDFEAGSSIESTSQSDTILSIETPSVNPGMVLGSKVAVIRLDAINDLYVGATTLENFILPLGRPVYLELNYFSNVLFSVGAIKHTSQNDETLAPFFNFYPSEDWNKIYIDLTTYVNGHTDALSFEIYFSCLYDEAVTDNIVAIDNIKLIYQ